MSTLSRVSGTVLGLGRSLGSYMARTCQNMVLYLRGKVTMRNLRYVTAYVVKVSVVCLSAEFGRRLSAALGTGLRHRGEVFGDHLYRLIVESHVCVACGRTHEDVEQCDVGCRQYLCLQCRGTHVCLGNAAPEIEPQHLLD